MTHFTAAVLKVVNEVPMGNVVSYGQVAAYVRLPRGARHVGWVLRQSHIGKIPWWRVVNNEGIISIKDNWEHDANEQKDLLTREGVKIGSDFSLDMKKYRYIPDKLMLKNWGLSNEYLKIIYEKFKTGY